MDFSVLGPNGYPSLRFDAYARDDKALWALPYSSIFTIFSIPEEGRFYKITVTARATRNDTSLHVQLSPVTDRHHPYKKVFQVGRQWEDFAYTVYLDDASHGEYLASLLVEGDSRLWVERVSIRPVEPIGGLPDISAGAVVSTERENNLFLQGEPLTVRVTAVGDYPASAKLQVVVEDALGEIYGPREFELGSGNVERFNFDLDEWIGGRLGAFRVECTVLGSSGEQISIASDTVVHRVPRPKWAQNDYNKSKTGVWAASFYRQDRYRLFRKLGIRNLMNGFRWNETELAKGFFDWEVTDNVVEAAYEEGLNLVAMLGDFAPWATVNPQENLHASAKELPADPKDWLDFLEAFMARHGERVDAYVGQGFDYVTFGGGDATLEQFTRAYQQLADAVQAVDPGSSAGILYPYMDRIRGGGRLTNPIAMTKRLDNFEDACVVLEYHPDNLLRMQKMRHNLRKVEEARDEEFQQVAALQSFERIGETRVWWSRHAPVKNDTGELLQYAGDSVRWIVYALSEGFDQVYLLGFNDPSAHVRLGCMIDMSGLPGIGGCALAALNWHVYGMEFVERRIGNQGLSLTTFADDTHGLIIAQARRESGDFSIQIPSAEVKVRDIFGNEIRTGSIKVGQSPVYLSFDIQSGDPGEAEVMMERLTIKSAN